MDYFIGQSRRDGVKVRFSILMPVYNREKYLRQAIDSVLAQTFTDYELIAVDDGSTDGSVELLESYGDQIKILKQHHQGPEVARNTAAAIAEGAYLVFLDSDDFLFPNALATYDQVIRNFDLPPLILGTMLFFQVEMFFQMTPASHVPWNCSSLRIIFRKHGLLAMLADRRTVWAA
jgi:glycosyltransferase involved in cell wall biosynthesis